METAHPYGFDNEHVLRDLLALSDDEIMEATIAGAWTDLSVRRRSGAGEEVRTLGPLLGKHQVTDRA